MSEIEPGGVQIRSDGTVDQGARLQIVRERMRAEQNLAGGLAAGLAASLAGAGLWSLITVMTNFQIGWMAVGVGLLVGYAMRAAGKGVDAVFGLSGAALSLFGCLLGNLLTVSIVVSKQEGIPLLELLSGLTLGTATDLMAATFSPIDLVFYGIALFEGYKLSFRTVAAQDLAGALPS